MAPLNPFASLYIPATAAAPPPSDHVFYYYASPPPPPPSSVSNFVPKKNYLQLFPINSSPLNLNLAADPFFSFPLNVIAYLQILQHPNCSYHNSYPWPHLDKIIPFKHEQELFGCFYGNYNMPRALPPMPMSLPSIQMHSEEPYYTSTPPLSEEVPCIIKEVVEEEEQQEKEMKINCPDRYMVKRAIIKPSFINKWKSKGVCYRRKTQRSKKPSSDQSVDDDQQHHLQQQQEEEYSLSASLCSKTATITTLMIRNIPNKFE